MPQLVLSIPKIPYFFCWPKPPSPLCVLDVGCPDGTAPVAKQNLDADSGRTTPGIECARKTNDSIPIVALKPINNFIHLLLPVLQAMPDSIGFRETITTSSCASESGPSCSRRRSEIPFGQPRAYHASRSLSGSTDSCSVALCLARRVPRRRGYRLPPQPEPRNTRRLHQQLHRQVLLQQSWQRCQRYCSGGNGPIDGPGSRHVPPPIRPVSVGRS